jgi:hypothetical protein
MDEQQNPNPENVPAVEPVPTPEPTPIIDPSEAIRRSILATSSSF